MIRLEGFWNQFLEGLDWYLVICDFCGFIEFFIFEMYYKFFVELMNNMMLYVFISYCIKLFYLLF